MLSQGILSPSCLPFHHGHMLNTELHHFHLSVDDGVSNVLTSLVFKARVVHMHCITQFFLVKTRVTPATITFYHAKPPTRHKKIPSGKG
jgi:hypothetical protein